MHKVVQTSLRDPKSFKMLFFTEVAQRVLIRQEEGEEYPTLYEPPTMSMDEFVAELEKVGQPKIFEQYICPETALDVVRGMVVKDDGREYCYYITPQQSGRLLSAHVRQVISQLTYSGNLTR